MKTQSLYAGAVSGSICFKSHRGIVFLSSLILALEEIQPIKAKSTIGKNETQPNSILDFGFIFFISVVTGVLSAVCVIFCLLPIINFYFFSDNQNNRSQILPITTQTNDHQTFPVMRVNSWPQNESSNTNGTNRNHITSELIVSNTN